MTKGKAAIIGAGVIGAGWAARFLLNGWDAAIYDPAPDAARKLDEVLQNARRALPKLYNRALPDEGELSIAPSIKAAVQDAAWVQESVPERLEIKHKTLAQIQAHCEAGAVIGSSTSGFKPSDLQQGARDPGQILVAHPFNPVYLLPLVELVPSDATHPQTLEKAQGVIENLGMKPLVIRKEIDAFIADRLMEALWREALWLVNDGVASASDIDDAIRYGCGLRWAQMGTFQTFHIAGGEAGMRHFLAQFGPALKWPWTKLMDTPELTPDLIETIAAQTDAQAGGRDVRELERIRDDNLVAIMQALKPQNWGAGAVVAAHETRLYAEDAPKAPDISRPIITIARKIPPGWTDYNGHMNEARYADLFSDAADAMMRLVGCDEAYIERGLSFFTVELHTRFLNEAKAGEAIEVHTQMLAGGGKKMHLFHSILRGEDLIGTGEQLLLHVDLKARRTCPPAPEVARDMARIAAAHAALPVPEGAGKAIGEKR